MYVQPAVEPTSVPIAAAGAKVQEEIQNEKGKKGSKKVILNIDVLKVDVVITDQATDQATDQPPHQATDQATDQPIDQATDQAIEHRDRPNRIQSFRFHRSACGSGANIMRLDRWYFWNCRTYYY